MSNGRILRRAWCGLAENGGEPGLRLVHALKLYLNRGLLGLLQQAAVEARASGAQQPNGVAR